MKREIIHRRGAEGIEKKKIAHRRDAKDAERRA
jgi:hypothetical protein